MTDIREMTALEFFNHRNCPALLDEYAEECRIAGMPTPKPDIPLYTLLESSGSLKFLGAFDENEMVGFLVFLSSQNPHYSKKISTIESVFVAKEKRKGGAGLDLVYKAREMATEVGSVGMFMSAPTGGAFSKVLKGIGASNTNDVFFWGLNG